VVQNIGKHKIKTIWDMILTTQIGGYEMDQVISNLQSDADVLPKKTR